MSDDERTVEPLIAAVRGRPRAMMMLARTLLLPRRMEARARDLAAEALALAPDDPETRALADMVSGYGIGSWYFTMVQDRYRHALYAEAFRRVVRPGSTVLDIGAGTGLFAMMAAREGAGRVVACERHQAVADAARAVVERNGYADRVTILAKDLREMEVGQDIEEPADVLLWDNLANNLIGVGALATLDDARRRLVRPDAVLIPARVELCAALVEDRQPEHRAMQRVDGFDMTPFNALRPGNLTVGRREIAMRSEPVMLFDFDLQANVLPPTMPVREDVVVQPGRLDGIVQWLRFHLCEGIVYDTLADGVSAFGLQLHPIEPIEVTAPRTMRLCGNHDGEKTWFWAEP